jgi:hypothetical protein
MAKFVLNNVRLFAGGADLTTVNNKLEIMAEVEEKDATSFAATGGVWHESLGGIRSTSTSASGQWEALDSTKVDNVIWSQLGSISAMTACPAGATFGSLAWFTAALRTNYTLGGSVGDVAPWSASTQGSWPLVRGFVAVSPASVVSTTPFFGPPIQIVGGVPAGKSLYAALHVLSVSGTGGPTLTATVNSDDSAGFPSATTRITFPSQAAVGSQIMRVAGPITDDYFAFSYVLTGTTPSFLTIAVFGIA